jgi:hypothetical protein
MRKALTLVVVAVAVAVVRGATGGSGIDAANSAWQRGDYIAALSGYLRALNGPGGDDYLEPIALTTGELYRSYELTADGRAGRFSPDGRYIVYETGLETSRRTRILRNDHARDLVVELPGVSATFTSDSARVAYLRVDDSDAIKHAAEALDAATLTQPDRNALVQALTWQLSRDSTIVVRDLASGRETVLPTPPALVKSGLAFAADNASLLFLGAREGEDGRTDIYRIAEGDAAPAMAVDAGGLKNAPMVAANGAVLVYTIPNVSPLRRPAAAGGRGGRGAAGGLRAGGASASPAEARGASERAEAGGRGAPGGPDTVAAAGPPRPPSTFAIADLISKKVSIVAGTAPALSADGRTLAYVTRDGSEYALMVGPATGMQTAVKRTLARLDAPALSPDGRRIAWQMMPRDDWEIFVAAVDVTALKDERRITREIQHDILPRFIASDKLVAMIGEPRHRRSYLYDLSAPNAPRVRLFHNNTVRTIAPEYQWAASPEGTRLLVGAERDGDTVSPQRGVYLLDLTQRVTKADVLARLADNLKSETALKAAGTRAFQAIAADVRTVLAGTSVDRIFSYEKALFDFDSKHINRPGNRLASEFLFNTYKAFGYEPEYQWFEAARGNAAGGRGTAAAGAPNASTADPRAAAGVRTANVVATLRGTINPEIVYVISSHYDSVEAGPGADDDTSGTAALLEAARVLAGHPLPATVVFASMTGEEAGLLGSREFVRRAVENKTHIAGALNNDMVGWMNDERLDNTIRYSNPGIRDIQHAAAMLFTRLITYDALYWKGTDAMSFYDAYGDVLGGIGSYPVLGSPYYHQASDLLENENHQLIAETSKTTVATIMLLASSPSRLTNLKVDGYSGGTASLSWTPSPESGVTSYIVAYGPPASPLLHRVTATQPRVTLPHLPPGTIVSVKAVNARGLEGWDWARAKL